MSSSFLSSRPILAAVACLGLNVCLQESPRTSPRQGPLLFEGIWQLSRWKIDGDEIELPKEGGYLVLRDWTFKIKVGAKVIGEGSFTINARTTPGWINVKYADEKYKGQSNLGIYEFKGEELWLTMARAGVKDRPTDFGCKAGSDHVLVVYKLTKG